MGVLGETPVAPAPRPPLTTPASPYFLLVLALGSACHPRTATPASPVQSSGAPHPTLAPVLVTPAPPAVAPLPSSYVPWRGPPPVPGPAPPESAGPVVPATEATPTPPPLPEPRVQIERPYPLHHRPRPSGEIAAAVHDEHLARWNLGGSSDPSYPSSRAGFHPGTRVIVNATVPGARIPERPPVDRRTGRPTPTLSRHAIEAQARREGYWPFRLCMEDGLRREPDLAGKAVVDLSLGPGGRVTGARLIQATLEDEGVEGCVVAAARKLSFSPPPERRLRVRLEIALAPGDAPVLQVGPPDGWTAPTPGRIDLDAAHRSLLTALPALQECYAAGLERDFGLWGRLELRIDLEAEGSPVNVSEGESRFSDPLTTRCACDVLRRMDLPAPEGGAATLVVGVRFGGPDDREVETER